MSGRGEQVTWVECPRDAWQGLARAPSTDEKVRHLRHLLAAGFDHLDMGSFVSPRAVPQLADTEEVLARLPDTGGADLLCIIGNERGLARALAAKRVSSVGYPLSVSDTFQRRNLGRTAEESWADLEGLARSAAEGGLGFVVYLSMGFGNPYGDAWTPEVTAAAVTRLREMGLTRIALADTLGDADAGLVEAVLSSVSDPGALGLHLHAAPNDWEAKLEVALGHGVRWYEGALAGVGGCPFAADELVGNLPTERVLPWLSAMGLSVAPDLTSLPDLADEARRLASKVP